LAAIRRFRPGYSAAYIRSELTNLQKLLVPRPICAAAIGVHCQMYSGFGRRNEAYREQDMVMAGTSRSALSSGLNTLIFNRLLAVVGNSRAFDRPLTIPAVSKRVVRTLFAHESFPIAVFLSPSGLGVLGFLGICNRIHRTRIR
jgi:hypothetical protein